MKTDEQDGVKRWNKDSLTCDQSTRPSWFFLSIEKRISVQIRKNKTLLVCRLQCVRACISSNDMTSQCDYVLHVYVKSSEWRSNVERQPVDC